MSYTSISIHTHLDENNQLMTTNRDGDLLWLTFPGGVTIFFDKKSLDLWIAKLNELKNLALNNLENNFDSTDEFSPRDETDLRELETEGDHEYEDKVKYEGLESESER